jgi:hypothetical protein
MTLLLQRTALAGVYAMLVCSMAASSKTSPMQFDLVCPTLSRTMKAHNPGRVGYVSFSGPSSYYAVQRFSFDLGRGLYRNQFWRADVSERIKVERKFILVANDSEGFSRFNLRTNRYFSRQTASAQLDEIETAHCSRAAFSGFLMATPAWALKPLPKLAKKK